ncbi:MAG TPA: DUF262 domain-containing protein [Candidatus Onthousia faecipullorum]|uniref:DUF262 domain-containing protein n=1 Tax=Candidatus Onthousia faecipullorum TaxID=2840887 RepID=A0A9D1KCK5_9FIRM|nr:DUF262 domain-containing protein [Candidatus Onthousia faecipullorum]
MIKYTEPNNIAQIFSNEKSILYNIPKYQREYTWGQKEWGLLFNDVIENDKGYFLGSIICVDDSVSAWSDAILEVIDGQQRLTSISILLIALYNKLNKKKSQLDEDGLTDLNNIKRELVVKRNGKNISRLKPQVQNNNRDDYFSLLCENDLLLDHEKKNNASNRRIYRAYYYFSNLIDKYIEEVQKDDSNLNEIDILFELVNKFNSAILVSIQVETHKDAYMLFESLNNRGVPLSAIDLIKNLLISVSDDDGKSDDAYSKWKKILSYLGEDYSVQERFFRQFYNAYRDELNEPYKAEGKVKYALGYLATKSTILDIYEKLIKTDYEKFLNRVEKEARNYSILINNASEDGIIEELAQPLFNLDKIQGAPSYILLLYLLSKKAELNLNNKIIANIINYLTKFFVRRNITDYPNTRNLTKIFMDLVALIKDKKGTEIYDLIINNLKANSSSDEIFEAKLKGSIYLDNPDATRFLLCYYEDKFKTNEIYTNLWSRDSSNKYVWTIEHIFPEGENIPVEWVNMIANGNKAMAVEYLNNYAHTLGNLTITGYNQNLSNLSFEKKKNRVNKDGNYIGYRNGLKLNEDIVSKDSWHIEDIKERTNKLVDFFMKEFEL